MLVFLSAVLLHTSALAADQACGDLGCLLKQTGTTEHYETDNVGLRTRVLESPWLRTEIHLDVKGEIAEIEVFKRGTELRISTDRYGVRERVHEIFDEHGVLSQRTRWWFTDPEERWITIETSRYGSGKLVDSSIETVEATGRALGESACLQHIAETAPPVNVSGLDSILGHLFNTGATSRSEVHLRTEGCGSGPALAAVQDNMRNALSRGLACLMDPARGGSTRGRRDAQILLATLTTPSMTYTMKCFPNGIPGSSGPDVAGVASMCPRDPNSPPADPNRPAFPGISINMNVQPRPPDFNASQQRTMFHEMIHTLGYPHGHSPEVCYACEACCFGANQASEIPTAPSMVSGGRDPTTHARLPRRQQTPEEFGASVRTATTERTQTQADACSLCREPESARTRPQYINLLLKRSDAIGLSGVDAVGSVAAFVRGNYQGGDHGAFHSAAAPILAECNGTSLCSSDQRSGATFMLLVQSELARRHAAGATPLTAQEQAFVDGYNDSGATSPSNMAGIRFAARAYAAQLSGQTGASALAQAQSASTGNCSPDFTPDDEQEALRAASRVLVFAHANVGTAAISRRQLCGH